MVQRNSGARIEDCVLKRSTDAVEQARIMQSRTDVYGPVLFACPGLYVMPRFTTLRPKNLDKALNKLETLWRDCDSVQDFPSVTRGQYQGYVQSRPAGKEVDEAVMKFWFLTSHLKGTHAAAVHGDPTMENCMEHIGNPVWIDPDTRLVPREVELDCGKLLQTAYGYDGTRATQLVCLYYVRSLGVDMQLCRYYLATHLQRLWRHQPDKHAWATSVAKELLIHATES